MISADIRVFIVIENMGSSAFHVNSSLFIFSEYMLSPDTDDADDTRMLASLAPLPMVAATRMNKNNLTTSKEILQKYIFLFSN